jgi:transposase-like protein
MIMREACPQCRSTWYKRNGHSHTGKQTHHCKLCGRAFVLAPENFVITEEQRALVERLLLERISLRGICRAVGVGLQWLLQFMSARFQTAPEDLYVKPAESTPTVILQRLEAELAELWSCVGKKANRQWVWIALGATTRRILAFHVGDRSGQSAKPWGRRFLPGTKSRPHSTRISMPSTPGSFLPPNTVLSPSSPASPITSNGSTARYDSGSPGWCVPRCRSRRTWPITSELSSISFVPITSPSVQHYQNSTTQSSVSIFALYHMY